MGNGVFVSVYTFGFLYENAVKNRDWREPKQPMRQGTFHHGIHPADDGKAYTKEQAIHS